jgi:uncharacterized phage protein (predicted DNA packaging)
MVELELVKNHLNIDDGYSGDDNLIQMYIETAYEQIKGDSGCTEDELLDNEGMLMPIPRQALLLLVGDYYTYREDTYNGTLGVQPKGYKRLINLIRHYD